LSNIEDLAVELRALLGREAVIDDPRARLAYRQDGMGAGPGTPALVVLPAGRAQAAAALRACAAAGVEVVTGGTGHGRSAAAGPGPSADAPPADPLPADAPPAGAVLILSSPRSALDGAGSPGGRPRAHRAGGRIRRAVVFAFFPHPRRLRLLRGPIRAWQTSGLPALVRRHRLLRRLAPAAEAMDTIAPPLGRRTPVPARTGATGPTRGTVGLVLGCVPRELFPDTNAATARVLAAEGFDVVAPGGQGCCGALSAHNGRDAEARGLARSLIDTFEGVGVDHLVVNAAGCSSTMASYADLLADDPAYAGRATAFSQRVVDATELLARVGSVAPRHPLPVTVAYHDACHLAHGRGVRDQPRALLSGIPDLELRELAEGSVCCGSSGIWNVAEPAPDTGLGERKAAAVLDTGARLVVTANPGCLLQVAAAIARVDPDAKVAVAHPLDVLDASIRGLPVEALVIPDERVWVDGPGPALRIAAANGAAGDDEAAAPAAGGPAA
jgi:glycolate oxidase iron-sulfur subunit